MTGTKHFTIENFSAGVLIIWGAFAASGFDSSFTTNPRLYTAMFFLIGSQFFWGSFFLIVGLVGIYLNYRSRKHAALLLGIVYAFFSSLFFFGDYLSKAWVYYGLFSFFNLQHWRGFSRH